MTDIVIAKKLLQLNQSAKKREIEFNLSFRRVKQLLSRKTCFYTGMRFNSNNPRSIDRVDNNRGYVNDNVVACGVTINTLKSNLTIKQIDLFHKKIHSFIKK